MHRPSELAEELQKAAALATHENALLGNLKECTHITLSNVLPKGGSWKLLSLRTL